MIVLAWLSYAQKKPESSAHKVERRFSLLIAKTAESAGNFLAILICIGCGHRPTASVVVSWRPLASHGFDAREMPVFLSFS